MAPLASLILAAVPFPKVPYAWTHYVEGATPISTPASVGFMLVSYLIVIFGLQHLMRDQKPLKLHNVSQVHNLFLSSFSGLLLLLILEEVVPIYWKHGLFHALCNENSWTSHLEYYYMLNYYTKYIELIDTVFLVLKKKQLSESHRNDRRRSILLTCSVSFLARLPPLCHRVALLHATQRQDLYRKQCSLSNPVLVVYFCLTVMGPHHP